jgi:hypothetical protein
VVKGSPACHRAVLETVEALRNAGHACVQIDPPDSTSRIFSPINEKCNLRFQLHGLYNFSLQ